MQELLDKCHPLGMFDSIATLAVASSMRELYRLVLVDTPLAPYFSESLSAGRQLPCNLRRGIMRLCLTDCALTSATSAGTSRHKQSLLSQKSLYLSAPCWMSHLKDCCMQGSSSMKSCAACAACLCTCTGPSWKAVQ